MGNEWEFDVGISRNLWGMNGNLMGELVGIYGE